MLSRLHPDYQKLGDYINLELVPFQRCHEYRGKWECTCQHGERECLGNKYFSCALATTSTKVALEYIACLEQEKVTQESFQVVSYLYPLYLFDAQTRNM
nr:unnamed protein product [Callosobruchus chinensis]